MKNNLRKQLKENRINRIQKELSKGLDQFLNKININFHHLEHDNVLHVEVNIKGTSFSSSGWFDLLSENELTFTNYYDELFEMELTNVIESLVIDFTEELHQIFCTNFIKPLTTSIREEVKEYTAWCNANGYKVNDANSLHQFIKLFS